ncbi:MAG: helix-turn-helix domain-containing protein, partial [Magnetococcales bacterium]|nr:helix-turn-helix domain-containing protein [Magnetococcales bacterium]
MSYSIDLRTRVVDFVKLGGSKTEAARVFSVSRRTVYYWLERPDLAPTTRAPYGRKLNKDDLAVHVRSFPDALLRERAEHFGVKT